MSATNQFEVDLMTLIFNNVAAQKVGDAAGLLPSAVAGSFYVSLHTAALSDTDTLQTASEAAYTGYARTAIARSAAGWTIAAGVADNAALVAFPASTSGPEIETYFGLGFNVSGAGYLQLWAILTSSLTVNNGITPQFLIGALDITMD